MNKTYSHAINEHTPAWIADLVGREVPEAVRALDDALIYFAVRAGCKAEELHQSRIAIGQIEGRGSVSRCELMQAIERLTGVYLELVKLNGLPSGEYRKRIEDGAVTSGELFSQLQQIYASLKESDPMDERIDWWMFKNGIKT